MDSGIHSWDRALLTQTLLSRTSARALFTPYVATPDGFGYGYGWYSGTLRTHPMLFHPGDNPGFLAMNILFPRERATIILLSNNAPRLLRDTFMTDTLPSLMTMLFG